MTQVDKHTNEHDLETPDSIQVRFGISYVESRPAEAVAALSMPMERFRNPFNGAPTVGPLAILVDAAAGIVNHYRRRPGQWTVSSELSMDLSLDGVGHLDGPVLATAHAFGPLGATSLGDMHADLSRNGDRRRHGAVVLYRRRRCCPPTPVRNPAQVG